jgi:AraC-like DNA-binding protein
MASPPDFRPKASTPAHVIHGKRVSERSPFSAANSIRFGSCRRLARKHWAQLPLALFLKLTSVKLDVMWISNSPQRTAGEEAGTSSLLRHIVVKYMIVGVAFLQALGKTGKSRRPAKIASSRLILGPATALLGLFVTHVEVATHLEVTTADLAKERLRAATHEHEEARLRKGLHRALPRIRCALVVRQRESHAEQVVHRLLDSIHADYSQPLGLKECASQLGLNPVYLCSLFSRIVGVPFKTYLTELRMEKAKEFLSNPTRRVSEVAYAVGYRDANRFRLAFKAATGLPPAGWRNSLRIQEQDRGAE